MPLGSFKRPAPAAAKAGGARKKSRYSGIKMTAPRDPMPWPGLYRFEIVEIVEGVNPGTNNESVKVYCDVIEVGEGGTAHKPGDRVLVLFMATTTGLGNYKRLISYAAGYEDESEYDAFDPDGEFQAACAGAANDYSAAGLTVVGRVVDVLVTKGGACGESDFFREYTWSVVPDAEQPSLDKVVMP